jgi:hypothetical protein
MGTKRLLIATATLVISVLSAVPCSAASPLELLVGPVAPIGSTAYDKLALTQGAIYRDSWPSLVGDVVGSNYYDLALSLYLLYARTGDTSFRDKARAIAEDYRDLYLNQNINGYLNGNYSLEVLSPRSFATLGMAIYVLEHGDAAGSGRSMAQIVDDQARLGARNFSPFTNDARESAYALMAMLASTVIGAGDHRADALTALNGFLAAQSRDGSGSQPNGCWQNIDSGSLVPARYYILNYMQGLVMEALIIYDRVIGDARIVPALQKCVAWEWTTQWVPAVPTSSPAFGAFQYANITSGEVSTNAYSDLNGLLLPAWGHLYAKTGNAAYKTQGDVILSSMVTGDSQPAVPGSGIYSIKQFGQEFRSSPRYPGFTSSSLAAPSGLTVY